MASGDRLGPGARLQGSACSGSTLTGAMHGWASSQVRLTQEGLSPEGQRTNLTGNKLSNKTSSWPACMYPQLGTLCFHPTLQKKSKRWVLLSSLAGGELRLKVATQLVRGQSPSSKPDPTDSVPSSFPASTPLQPPGCSSAHKDLGIFTEIAS